MVANRIAGRTLMLRVARRSDREPIFRTRHRVYARELRQHRTNRNHRLSDALDEFNTYLLACRGRELAGFISITPPDCGAYSIDKYFRRAELPLEFDDRLFEVRLLTVRDVHRGGGLALLLMYAALRWVESQGGQRIVAMGRREILNMYARAGLRPLGISARSGAVEYELLAAEVDSLRDRTAGFRRALERLARRVEWKLDIPFESPGLRSGGSRQDRQPAPPKRAACYHGGAFFEAIGPEFDQLDRRHAIVNADVLDAWFDPSPKVMEALRSDLPWLLRTSPPTGCEGMISAIARARGVDPGSILPGAGSSDLIFLALSRWLTPESRVLILDPMYAEYAHVLRHVIGCRVDRLLLRRESGYVLEPRRLKAALRRGYDLVILVNPNSPTGRHAPKAALQSVVGSADRRTRFWIDETYVEYVGSCESLEPFAAASSNCVVCKSMSKVYALSGVRAAYLCGPAALIDELRPHVPPWAVSLPGQVAAVKALNDPEYYGRCYRETHALRAELVKELERIGGIDVIPSVANFVLCHLAPTLPRASDVVAACRREGVFLRDVSGMGRRLGNRALRIAVKDRSANARIVAAIKASTGGQ